jgi:mannosyltransferase OCH1-like enzyme
MKKYLIILVSILLLLLIFYLLLNKTIKLGFIEKYLNKKFNRYNFWDEKFITTNRNKYLKNTKPYKLYNNPLFQTYYDKSKIPSDIYDNIRKYASDYTHVIMDDKDIESFLNTYYKSNVLDTFKSLKLGAHKADLARYCILYIYGGLYMDIKVELIKPLSEIFTNDSTVYTVISILKNDIHQGIIKSPPNNPLFLSLIDYVVSTNDPGDYLDFCRDFYVQIEKDVGEVKDGINLGKSGNKYYLFREKSLSKEHCYDGLDRHGYCSFIFDGENKIIKTRRSSYPWK